MDDRGGEQRGVVAPQLLGPRWGTGHQQGARPLLGLGDTHGCGASMRQQGFGQMRGSVGCTVLAGRGASLGRRASVGVRAQLDVGAQLDLGPRWGTGPRWGMRAQLDAGPPWDAGSGPPGLGWPRSRGTGGAESPCGGGGPPPAILFRLPSSGASAGSCPFRLGQQRWWLSRGPGRHSPAVPGPRRSGRDEHRCSLGGKEAGW